MPPCVAPPMDASCRCTSPTMSPSRGALVGMEPSWFVRHGRGNDQELGGSLTLQRAATRRAERRAVQ